MTMRIYPELKERQRVRKPLLPSERDFIDRVERIVGYEVALHLPAGAKFVLGAADAEAILRRIMPCADGEATDAKEG